MKKLLLILITIVLISPFSYVQPFAFAEVEGPDVYPSECDGEYCSLVELSPKLKPQYQSCYYFAMSNHVICTDHSGKVTKTEVTTSSNIETNKNFIGTYYEKRDDQFIRFYLYAKE